MRFPDRTLSETEVIAKLKRVPNFMGVYSRDALPQLPESKSFSMVVNLDDSSGPGTHWVALYHDKGSEYLEYFDSFGVVPPLEISHPRGGRKWDILYNDGTLQDLESTACGYYCIDFIKSRYRGMSYPLFVEQFKEFQGARNEKVLME